MCVVCDRRQKVVVVLSVSCVAAQVLLLCVAV